MEKSKVQVFENVLGEWVASNGLLTAFGKTKEDALKEFKRMSKNGNL